MVIFCCCCCCCWKSRRKPQYGRGKSEMRGSGSSYIPLSAPSTTTAFPCFQVFSHVNSSPYVLKGETPTTPFPLCQIWGLCFFAVFSGWGAGADMWKIHPVVCGHAFNTWIHCTCTSIMFWHYEGIVAFCLVFILTIKEKENCFVFPGYDYLLQNLIYPDAQAWTLILWIVSKLWRCKKAMDFLGGGHV